MDAMHDARQMIDRAYAHDCIDDMITLLEARMDALEARERMLRALDDAQREEGRRLRTAWAVLYIWAGAVAVAAVTLMVAARAAGLAAICR